MKKLILLFASIIIFIFTSCKYEKHSEICEYELLSINSYIGNFSENFGSIGGTFFLGTGQITGNMYGVSITTSNIFCILKDKHGAIHISSIPAKNCDIVIINDSTQRKAYAYRFYLCDCSKPIKNDIHRIQEHYYWSASNIKEILDTINSEKFDTVEFFSNGKVRVPRFDNNYNEQKNYFISYDLNNDCTYYVFYVLEKDIITLSELK